MASSNPPRSPRTAIALLLLGGLVYAGLYLHSAKFGLYEDDFWLPLEAILTPPGGIISRGWYYLVHPIQGRPLLALTYTLIAGANAIGGLWGVHLGAYLIKFGCAAVAFSILRRFVSEFAALLGAALFILEPSHTAGQLVIHSYGVFLACFFALGALRLYQARHPWWAMAAAAISMLMVESFIIYYIVAPLLRIERTRAWVRRAIIHAMGVALLILAVLLGRWFAGEQRVVQYAGSPRETFRLVSETIVNGTKTHATNLWVNASSSVAELFHQSPVFAITLFFTALVFTRAALLYFSSPRQSDLEDSDLRLGLFLFCLVAVPAAYATAFKYHPATWTGGRLSWIHFLGAFPVAAVCALLIDAGVRTNRAVRLISVAGCALVSVAVGTFQLRIQNIYVQCWANQRQMFGEALSGTPDLGPRSLIVVNLHGAPATTAVMSSSWADTLVLDQVFRWPPDWSGPANFFASNEPDTLTLAASRMVKTGEEWKFSLRPWLGPEGQYVAVDPKRIAYFEYHDGHFLRQARTWMVQGVPLSLSLAPADSVISSLRPDGPLAAILLGTH
ncbi:hypothetical protein [Opitutus sp. GAS368]|uniref:hypothetical protein n=1 Tax=Opitutus sp. GAS368 TaxID=1882749 RepID=UPI00087B536C|nr:hypothetical protein [Opitutus sp. GAS368]SDS27089.1 hypothetical protein SAMN05444173_2387 [Opitutus sp. GAS368]